jgi:hypothetical protein
MEILVIITVFVLAVFATIYMWRRFRPFSFAVGFGSSAAVTFGVIGGIWFYPEQLMISIGATLGGLIVLLITFYYEKKYLRSQKQVMIQKEHAMSRYRMLQESVDNLFSEADRPLNEKEIKKIKSDKNSTLIITPLFSLGFAYAAYYLHLNAGEVEYIIGFSALAIAFLSLGIYYAFVFKTTLKSDRMYMLTGIVTDKISTEIDDSETYYVEVSEAFKVRVDYAFYKPVTHGDIVRIDSLTKGYREAFSQEVIGNILDVDSEKFFLSMM